MIGVHPHSVLVPVRPGHKPFQTVIALVCFFTGVYLQVNSKTCPVRERGAAYFARMGLLVVVHIHVLV